MVARGIRPRKRTPPDLHRPSRAGREKHQFRKPVEDLQRVRCIAIGAVIRLENGGVFDGELKHRQGLGNPITTDVTRRTLEIQKLVRRLALQGAALDRTILGLERLSVRPSQSRTPSQGRANKAPPTHGAKVVLGGNQKKQ